MTEFEGYYNGALYDKKGHRYKIRLDTPSESLIKWISVREIEDSDTDKQNL